MPNRLPKIIVLKHCRSDLDAVFAKWLLTALARTLLKLVTLVTVTEKVCKNDEKNSPKIQI